MEVLPAEKEKDMKKLMEETQKRGKIDVIDGMALLGRGYTYVLNLMRLIAKIHSEKFEYRRGILKVKSK